MNYSKMKKDDLIALVEGQEVELKDLQEEVKDLKLELEEAFTFENKYEEALRALIRHYRLHKASPEVYTADEVLENLEILDTDLSREDNIWDYEAPFQLIGGPA